MIDKLKITDIDEHPGDVRLKGDTFGEIWLCRANGNAYIERRVDRARPWARWLANWLARREGKALLLAQGISGVPELLHYADSRLRRELIPGEPMQEARPRDPDYYRESLRLLRRLHQRGIAHNDLAKEPNWLVTDLGAPALVDFQLASISTRRGLWFRALAREDIRHLLKHKRTYCPDRLSARQKAILANKAPLSRIWMATGKPVYIFITRRLLGWSDREGAYDRDSR